MDFYKKENGEWKIGRFSVGSNKCLVSTDPETGRITIRIIGSYQVCTDKLPTEFQGANGNFYADLAAYEEATAGFFVNATQEVANPTNNGNTINVVQGLGSSVEDVMSQYAVTDKINRLQSMVDAVSGGFESSILFDSPAPTPAKNCFYEFINDGICIYLNNKQVYSGDRLYVTFTAPSTYVYNYGHDVLSNRESVLNSIVNTVTKLVDVELVHPTTWIPGYVSVDGNFSGNEDFKYFEFPYSGIPIKLTCDVGMGGVVAIVSYFNEDIFLGFQYPGTNNLNNVSLIIPSGTTKINFSVPKEKDLILKTEELVYYDLSGAFLDIENAKLDIAEAKQSIVNLNSDLGNIGNSLKGFSPYTPTWIPGYVSVDGNFSGNEDYKYFEISEDITKYKITTISYMGGGVALTAFFNGDTFLSYGLAGSQVLFDHVIIPPNGTTKIVFSTSNDPANNFFIKKYQYDGVSKEYVDSVGCGYAGLATLSGTPSNSIGNKFYVANLAGTYTNYGGVTIPNNGIYFIKYINSIWSLEKLTDIFYGYSNSRLKGEKWMAVGDSITGNAGYINETISLLGLSNDYINKGFSGRRLQNMIYESDSSTLISADEILSCKLITIISQANDYGSSRPIGTLNDAIVGNENTYYGDCKKVIDYYLNINPNAVLVLGSELPQSYDGVNWFELNSVGATKYDYSRVLKEVCTLYSVCYIDLYSKSGCNKYTQNSFYNNDWVHPSSLGNSAMAKLIAREIYNYITV